MTATKKKRVKKAVAAISAVEPATVEPATVLEVPPDLLKAVPEGWKLRSIQSNALVQTHEKLMDPKTQFVILEAPPGVGKSLLGITLGRKFGPAAVITATVQLQEQYLADFEKSGLKVLKGRRNFRCGQVNDTCDFGVKMKCESVKKGTCPYQLAKKEALESPLLTANYHSFWRHMGKAKEVQDQDGEPLEGRQLVIMDEAHAIETTVMDQASVLVRVNDLPLTLPPVPDEQKDPEPLYQWMNAAYGPLKALAVELGKEDRFDDQDKVTEVLQKIQIVLASSGWYERDSISKSARDLVKRKRPGQKLKALGGTMLELTAQEVVDGARIHQPDMTDYIVERGLSDAGVVDPTWFALKPLHVRHIAKAFWAGFPRVLFMSATILNAWEFCNALGLDPNAGEFVQIKESFPPENRPICLGSLDMSYKARDESWPHMVRIVEGLMSHHSDVKGLILTQSNVMLKHIMQHLSPIHRQRLIPAFGDDRMEKYNEHLLTRGPSVLIASGYWEGADLKNDASRFQILPACPRPMWSGQIAARGSQEPRWYRLITWQKFIQGLGRSVRSESDEAITYVLDIEFQRELAAKDSMIPEWVRVAVRQNGGG